MIIDEVQKAPELLSVVHEILELKKAIVSFLPAPAHENLSGTEWRCLPAGRFLQTMHSVKAGETGAAFSLETALEGDHEPSRTEPRGVLRAQAEFCWRGVRVLYVSGRGLRGNGLLLSGTLNMKKEDSGVNLGEVFYKVLPV